MPLLTPPDSDYTDKFKVCIIGAGPAGLCSLRHLLPLATTNNISVVVFEQQSDIGGVWNYAGPGVKLWDSKGNPMTFPMYSDLRCNLPKQLMEFHDFKHKRETNTTFVTQQELHDYLMEYADLFQLWPYIKLNARVVSIKPKGSAGANWQVTIEDMKTFQRNIFPFDAIVSCVGVNYYPKIPAIIGMSKFQGEILHSKHFKTVDEFKDKSVVLLGLGPSSADLCMKLGPVAKQVGVSHRFPGGFQLGLLPPNVRETATIKALNEWSVITEKDEEVPCDVLILCTGYKVHFPFLDCFTSADIGVGCLYKRMFVPSHPSFCFINAHGLVSEFLVMEIQAKYFAALLERKFTLPPLAFMQKQAELEQKLMSHQGKLTESLRSGSRAALAEVEQYLLGMAKEAGCLQEFKHIPLQLAVWQWVIRRIFGKLAVYRMDEVQILSPTRWEYVCAKKKEDENRVATVFELCEDGAVLTFEREHS